MAERPDIEWRPVAGGTVNREVLMEPIGWHEPLRVLVPADPDLFDDNQNDNAILDQVFAVMWWASRHAFTVVTDNHYGAGSYLTTGRRTEWVGQALLRTRRRLEPTYRGPRPPIPLPNVSIVSLDGRPLGTNERHRSIRNLQPWFAA